MNASCLYFIRIKTELQPVEIDDAPDYDNVDSDSDEDDLKFTENQS